MQQDLSGPWHPITAVLAGRILDVAEIQVAHLEFLRDEYMIFDRTGAVVDGGSFELNQTTRPWSLDLHGRSISGAGKRLQAICRVREDGMGGEILELSYALDGGPRPVSFDEAEALCADLQSERLVIGLKFQRLSPS